MVEEEGRGGDARKLEESTVSPSLIYLPSWPLPASHQTSATYGTGRADPSGRTSLWWLRVCARAAVYARGTRRPSLIAAVIHWQPSRARTTALAPRSSRPAGISNDASPMQGECEWGSGQISPHPPFVGLLCSYPGAV